MIRHMWSFHIHPVLRLPYMIVILFLYLPSITARKSSRHDGKPILSPMPVTSYMRTIKRMINWVKGICSKGCKIPGCGDWRSVSIADILIWLLTQRLLNSNMMYDTCMQTCTFTSLHISSIHRFKTLAKTINPSA